MYCRIYRGPPVLITGGRAAKWQLLERTAAYRLTMHNHLAAASASPINVTRLTFVATVIGSSRAASCPDYAAMKPLNSREPSWRVARGSPAPISFDATFPYPHAPALGRKADCVETAGQRVRWTHFPLSPIQGHIGVHRVASQAGSGTCRRWS